METTEKVLMLREAANNEAILNCYRNITFRAIQKIKEKDREIQALEIRIHELKDLIKTLA